MSKELRSFCNLEGRVAVVFGCATGIGAASARRLAERGARVVLADIDEARVTDTAAHIARAGGEAVPVCCDVRDEARIAAAIRMAVDRFGRLDIVHNNAAAMHLVSSDKDVCSLTAELWDQTMQVNARGQMIACKHAIGPMLASGGGSIVNTSSLSGIAGELTSTAYGASKAAINQLTRAVATQYGARRIRCNAVLPGLIQFDGERPAGRGLPAALRESLKRHQLTPEPGRADDVANAVAFLVSDEARFITGQLLVVDGGMSAHQPFYADMRDLLDAV
ncbi:SDR family NAD(P)-dependent oxidoreductase [Paraburkholderia sp.]|uniref:SDR family NAD(P)-dependent oxidoreductase n=1 Tax=Paraburkholderia sp. TaxID=1926495 RepID=UPI0039E59B6D